MLKAYYSRNFGETDPRLVDAIASLESFLRLLQGLPPEWHGGYIWAGDSSIVKPEFTGYSVDADGSVYNLIKWPPANLQGARNAWDALSLAIGVVREFPFTIGTDFRAPTLVNVDSINVIASFVLTARNALIPTVKPPGTTPPGTTPPGTTPPGTTPPVDATDKKKTGVSTGAIVGIAMGAAAVSGGLIWLLSRPTTPGQR